MVDSPLIRPYFLGGGGIGGVCLGSHESTGPRRHAGTCIDSRRMWSLTTLALPRIHGTRSLILSVGSPFQRFNEGIPTKRTDSPMWFFERGITALNWSQWGEVISFLNCQCDYCEHGNLPNWQNPTYHQFQLIALL